MTFSPRPRPQRDSRFPAAGPVKTPSGTAPQTLLADQRPCGCHRGGCVTLGVRRMCSRKRVLLERPDWRVSSVAVVPIKISWLTIPLACEPKGRGLVRCMRWDASSSASRFGQGPRRWPQRVFPDRRPSPPSYLQGCAPNSSPVCAFSFPSLHCVPYVFG